MRSLFFGILFFVLAAAISAAIIYIAGKVYGPPRNLPDGSECDHVKR